MKEYYETKGEWAGVFTMEPNKAPVKVDNSHCDVAYTYIPVPGAPFYIGQDSRRFTFKYNTSGVGYEVVSMGDYESGVTAM